MAIASTSPVIETRRERRERELAEALSVSATGSELAGSAAVEPDGLGSAIPADSAVLADGLAVAPAATRPVTSLSHLLHSSAKTPVDAVEISSVVEDAAVVQTAAVVDAAPVVEVTPVVEAAAAVAEAAAAVAASVEADTTTVSSLTFERVSVAAEPRRASTSVASSTALRSVKPVPHRRGASTRPRARKRRIVNSVVMVATVGLVATLALPAYAYSDFGNLSNANLSASSQLGIQSLTVAGSGVSIQDSPRDGYTTTGDISAMDSTTGTTVSPTVQALATELMADVASGKLVGSVPDHIQEIRNLANGVAVQGCGVDYRILQVIKVAVDNFNKVGVSDINRLCTGQIEGAGTASSHYANGGGHAVDFYILNGHGLTGADADSLKLIALLDPLVPPGTGLGQAECRGSLSVVNFAPFDDTCSHDHIDFGNAKGVSLKGM